MPPPPFVTSLDEVATGYTVFESDQVLTHTQLNSVAEYADDQIRLTRTRLSGVGVACGLHASLSGTTVHVTGGVGVTTDGDLLHLDADTAYDRFRPYDQSFPAYPPLYQGRDVNGTMFAAYELLPQGAQADNARPLAQLPGVSGLQLSRMTAVLLMESYRQDDDLCSGTDCDNLGARAVNTRKLLLVGPDAVAALRGGAETPADAYGDLPELFAERAVLTGGMTGTAALAQAYRTACTAIHARVVDALPRIFPAAGAVLGDVLTQASAQGWINRLATYRRQFARNAAGIQYYYDFLKDVVEAYNEFRDALFDDRTWCSPPIASFPKHLLLGDLTGGSSAEANRTGFYPSPVTSRTAGELDRACFLLRRLESIITHFQVSTASSLTVRVTPSAMENRPLEERAIPFYYTAGGEDPLHLRWSYRLSRRGAEASAYGYHAPASWAVDNTPADNPLAYQVGRSDFFRVEGVVGKLVGEALDAVRDEIRDHNLPFTVRAVLLGTDRTRIVPRPRGTTDLHHLHSLVRKDTDVRLQEAEAFTTHFSDMVLHAADEGELYHEQESAQLTALRGTTTSKSTELRSHSATARTSVSGSYTQYSMNTAALNQGMTGAIQAAADLSFQATPVATTGFFNPLDNLGAATQTSWLPWLDDIIAWKDEKKDERLLFSRFAGEHPQVEHLGGVPRGGTLVLLHDTAGTVVAEVMLPYALPEEVVEDEEPVLTTPPIRPPVVRTPPVRTVPTPKRTWEQEWVFREPELEVVFQAREDLDQWKATESEYLRGQVEWQNQYLQEQTISMQSEIITSMGHTYEGIITNQWNTLDSVASKYAPTRQMAEIGTQPGTTQQAPRATESFDDKMLGVYVEESRVREQKVNILREMTEADPADELLAQQLAAAEQELGRALEDTAQHLVSSGAEVSLGNEAYLAVEQMSRGMQTLSGSATLDATRTAIDGTVSRAGTASVEMAVKAAMPRMR
jgi:hypothetical protein